MEIQRPPAIRCMPLAEWPQIDRLAWIEATTPGDPFDDPRPASELSPASLRIISKSYGRWLCFLTGQGWLDPDECPLRRVSKQRLSVYFQELQAVGNMDQTILGRFQALAWVLKLLVPGSSTSWVRAIGKAAVHTASPKRSCFKQAPDSGLLFKLAVSMMDQVNTGDPKQLIDYRDGLLLALFVTRARRLRAMASLRIGHEVVRHGAGYRIELTPDLVKTKKHDSFRVPAELVPYVDTYLSKVRRALLAGKVTDAFWVSLRHGALSEKSVQERVFARTKQWFGKGFGPHRFRHAFVTTASLRGSLHPALGAAALGITGEVAEKHYNLACQVEATRKLNALISATRRHCNPVSVGNPPCSDVRSGRG